MDLVQEAKKLFGQVPRPEHFTNYTHCDECAEHDEMLRRQAPETLSYQDIGYGWDPFSFITPEGFQYYFPALARLALMGTASTYFVDRLLTYLALDGKRNARFMQFTPQQRKYVVKLLHTLVEMCPKEIEINQDSDRLFRTIEIWAEENIT